MLNRQESILAECLFQLGSRHDGSFHALKKLSRNSRLRGWQMRWALLQLQRHGYVDVKKYQEIMVRLTCHPENVDMAVVLEKCRSDPGPDQ